MTTTTPTPDRIGTPATLDELVAQLEAWRSFAAGRGIEDVTDAETWEGYVRALFTDRGGKLRRRKSPAKGATGNVRAVFGYLRFLGSGGSLEGLFCAQWQAESKSDWAAIETFGLVLKEAFGQASPALDAWRRTGLFG
jgi:hypothetical protein